MTSNIVAFKQAGLPSVDALKTALRSIPIESAGGIILKMDKTGDWVFGADQTEVQEGSEWAVNPFSFTHGFIAWGDAEVLGEIMVGITEPLPETPAAPSGAEKGWEKQVGLSLRCLNGDDEGIEVRYNATSLGGKKAVQALALEIAKQCDVDASTPVPVVTLKSEHYQHKKYGKIYTPIMEIVEWIDLGEEAPAPKELAKPAPAPAKKVAPPRKAVAQAIAEAPVVVDAKPVAEVEEAPAAAPARRRRAL